MHDWDSQMCLHITDLSLKGSSMSYTLSSNLTFRPIETTQLTVESHSNLLKKGVANLYVNLFTLFF